MNTPRLFDTNVQLIKYKLTKIISLLLSENNIEYKFIYFIFLI